MARVFLRRVVKIIISRPVCLENGWNLMKDRDMLYTFANVR